MKKLKSIVSVFLIGILTVGLVACGSKKEESKNTENEKDLKGSTIKIVATSEDYKPVFEKFTKETGIKVEFLSMSSGEVISRIKAEGGKPMADVWFGGGLDAFMDAKDSGLLEKYISEESKDIKEEYKDKEGYWMGKGLTIVGFLANKDVLKEKNLQIPKTWDDLAKPEYKNEILMSNPAVSGTNYAVVNALLQQKGKGSGWKYFENLNKNISYYSKRGKDPKLKTTAGEVAIGITYIDNSIVKLEKEKNMQVVYPEDGIPWVVEGMAIFKNASNLEGAKIFENWVLKKETQEELAKIDGKDGAMLVKPGVKGIDLKVPKDKLMKEDLSSFGKDRKEILDKWKAMVGNK
ncbi:ABC transporter substrate-binding protein [Clostridium sporogenes]